MEERMNNPGRRTMTREACAQVKEPERVILRNAGVGLL